MDLAWFRSLHYGFADPTATVCLWWCQFPDHRLHIRSELRRQGLTIEMLARDIKAQTRRLNIQSVRYTVADEENIGKEDGDGETRAETFAANGIPLDVIKPDPIQGWTRVRELLGLRPDHRPWLTIDPSCAFLIKALTSAMQDKTNSEDIMPFGNDQPLRALRVGAMSRPAPKWIERPKLPPKAIGHLVDELRTGTPAVKLAWR